MPVERGELERTRDELDIIYLRLLIEWQTMQNQILREMIKTGITPNFEILQFNKIAREWNEMNFQRPMPPNMYT